MPGITPMEAVATALLVASLAFTVAAVVGILRLPDFYSRLHAVGKCDTAALGFATLALALLSGDFVLGLKLALVWTILAMANPTATHALARAARLAGVPVWRAESAGEPPGSSPGDGERTGRPPR